MAFIPLHIEDSFIIKGRGLVLIPTLPIASAGCLDPFKETVIIQSSDGGEKQYRAYIHLEHFNYVDRPSAWRIVFELAMAKREEFQADSQLLVPANVISALKKVVK